MTRFPALDPEPPPPTRRERLLRAAAVGGALLGVVAVAVAVPLVRDALDDDARRSPDATASAAVGTQARGRVVVVDGNRLATTRPDGTSPSAVTGELPIEPNAVDLVPAPDGATAVLGTGTGFGRAGLLVDLEREAAPVPAVPADLLAGGGTAEHPWADRGAALLLLRSGADSDALSLVDRASGRATPLGSAGYAAADPVERAAFAVVAGPRVPGDHLVEPQRTSTALEHRRPGAAPVVLLTAARFAQLTRLPAGPVVIDRVVPSPDGQRLVVTGGTPLRPAPNDRYSRWSASVVLDRTGRVLHVRAGRPGRTPGWVRWGSAARVAMLELVETEVLFLPSQEVLLWDVAAEAAPREAELPGALQGSLAQPCAWAPDATRLRCGDDRGWFDLDAATGRGTPLTGVTGRPLLWVDE